MIKEDTFKKWLIEDMRYAGRSAKDVLSRCRRVERVLGINLNKAVKSKKGCDDVCQRLVDKADTYIKPGANKVGSVSIIATAVKLYHNFLNK